MGMMIRRNRAAKAPEKAKKPALPPETPANEPKKRGRRPKYN